MRPLLLLSNDDGHHSRGLRVLRERLMRDADVIVCAPEHEQSASSHALSLHRPLRLREVEPGVFAVDGTPADCVYVALNAGARVLPRTPDAVVSGINLGLNLGQDVFYSGTVAAAREGALRGLRALAASAHLAADFAKVADLCAAIVHELLTRPRAQATSLMNLNVPRRWDGSLRASRLGERIYDQGVEFRSDPRGREYLWIGGGGGVRHDPSPGTDTDAYDEGAASLTALQLDLTSREGAHLTEEIAKSWVHVHERA